MKIHYNSKFLCVTGQADTFERRRVGDDAPPRATSRSGTPTTGAAGKQAGEQCAQIHPEKHSGEFRNRKQASL